MIMAMMMWLVLDRIVCGHLSSVGAMVGILAGLVAITPCAGFVNPDMAMIIGALGSLACYPAMTLLGKVKQLDDSLDACGLHGVGGFVGAILVGFFAEEQHG